MTKQTMKFYFAALSLIISPLAISSSEQCNTLQQPILAPKHYAPPYYLPRFQSSVFGLYDWGHKYESHSYSLNLCRSYGAEIAHLTLQANLSTDDKMTIVKMIHAYQAGYVPEVAYPLGNYFGIHQLYAIHHTLSNDLNDQWSPVEEHPTFNSEGLYWSQLSEWLVGYCHLYFLADKRNAGHIAGALAELESAGLTHQPYLELGAGRGFMSAALRSYGVNIQATDPLVFSDNELPVEQLSAREAIFQYPNSGGFLIIQPTNSAISELGHLPFLAKQRKKPLFVLLLSDQFISQQFQNEIGRTLDRPGLSFIEAHMFVGNQIPSWRGVNVHTLLIGIYPFSYFEKRDRHKSAFHKIARKIDDSYF